LEFRVQTSCLVDYSAVFLAGSICIKEKQKSDDVVEWQKIVFGKASWANAQKEGLYTACVVCL